MLSIPLQTGLEELSERSTASHIHRVSPGDVLIVEVIHEADASGEFLIQEDGSFRHVFLGYVQVAGLTLSEIEKLMYERLNDGFLVEPQVRVTKVGGESVSVIINGQVVTPGVYEFSPGESITFITLLARAGGFTDIAKEDGVRVIRNVDGVETTISVKASRILNGSQSDIMLQSLDRIWVPESTF